MTPVFGWPPVFPVFLDGPLVPSLVPLLQPGFQTCLWNPVGVSGWLLATGTQGALRDPGFWCETPLGLHDAVGFARRRWVCSAYGLTPRGLNTKAQRRDSARWDMS